MMNPRSKLSIVEEPEAPADGDYLFYKARRLAKFGPPPAKPVHRAPPLERERLTSRSFEAVVYHAIVDRPKRASLWIWIKVTLVIFLLFAALGCSNALPVDMPDANEPMDLLTCGPADPGKLTCSFYGGDGVADATCTLCVDRVTGCAYLFGQCDGGVAN